MNNEAREQAGVTRRDFLGLAAFGAMVLSALSVFAGTLRIFKPNVYYEESSRFKIGKPEHFPVGTVKKLDDRKIFIFSEDDGFSAVSAVCTHLGCIVHPTEWGFQCPCHGSRYNRNGKVVGGPAPRSLSWYEITQEVDGSLVVNTAREVPMGTKFIYS